MSASVSQLMSRLYRELAHRARLYCEAYEKEMGERLLMRPYKCGVVCGCCDIFGCPKVRTEGGRRGVEVLGAGGGQLHASVGLLMVVALSPFLGKGWSY